MRTSGCCGHGERGRICGARDHPVFELQLHCNVVAFAAQAFALGVALIVIDDVADQDGAVAVLTGPACDGPASAGELLTDLGSGFKCHVGLLVCWHLLKQMPVALNLLE